MEVGAAVGRGEVAILEEAGAGLGGTFGVGPLDSAGVLAEHLVAEAGDVQVATAGECAVLVPDLLGVCVIEGLAVAERGSDAADDLPIRQRVARRLADLFEEADAAFAVRHRTGALAPLCGGQDHVGEAAGLGWVVGVLDDHQLRATQRRFDAGGVGQRGDGVAAGDPDDFDFVALEGFDHFDGGEAGAVRDRPGRKVPGFLGRGAVLGVGDEAMAGEGGGEAAGFAAAHGVGLAGEREGAGTGPADVAGGEREVQQGEILVNAGAALVGTHAPEAEHRPVGGNDARSIEDLLRVETGERRCTFCRVALERGFDLGPAGGVFVDEALVEAVETGDLAE